MNRTKIYLAIFAGIVVMVSAWLLTRGVMNFRSNEPQINVTGLAEKQITSDLIVWNITVKAEDMERGRAFDTFKKSAAVMQAYLKEQGIAQQTIATDNVEITKQTKDVYDKERSTYVSIDNGYRVSQTFTISSKDLAAVERVYQKISELYNRDIDFSTTPPLYYYTKLNDLKMEMLRQASANAYERARTIAEGSNASIGSMLSSSMGVFQIVGLNSQEEYSWGGTFNTGSKEKVASITVRTVYKIR